MKRKIKEHYNARWPGPSLASLANVSFTACSTTAAINHAKALGRKLGLPNTPFTLYRGNSLIHHGL